MSRTPSSYASYAETHPDPRFSDWLRSRSEPDWTKATIHPFTEALGDGTLSESAFSSYLVQDYAFINTLVGAFGYAVGQAPNTAAKRRLVTFLDTLTDEENNYFERSFDALNVPSTEQLDPAVTETTAAFIDLLGGAIREGGYEETLAVLVPAEWIYEQWATSVVSTGSSSLPFYYAEWIDLHATPDFSDFVNWLRGQLDAHGPTVSPRREARIDQLFSRTVALEVAFFDAAYDSEDE